jgi:hypothetical protein
MRRLQISLLAAVVVIGFNPITHAADMMVKAPPPAPAPVNTWTGFHIGGNAAVGGVQFGYSTHVSFSTASFILNHRWDVPP